MSRKTDKSSLENCYIWCGSVEKRTNRRPSWDALFRAVEDTSPPLQQANALCLN